MEAKDLRIGNIVLKIDENKTHKIVPVDISICSVNKKIFEPIPLTEEWLLKMGFSWHAKNSYNLKRFRYHTDKKIFSIMGRFEDLVEGLEHVNQLQNLYFALTGEELTIN